MSEQATKQDEMALVERALHGDGAAFTALVRRYQGSVYNLCRRFLPDADAQEAAQDAFMRVFVHGARFDTTRPLGPWLLTIARRVCIDKLRYKGVRREDATVDLEVAVPASAEAESAARQEVLQLNDALATLAEGPREALVLFHVEGLSYRDIADVLGVPIGTVMTWLHRTRAQLRTYLTTHKLASAGSRRATSGVSP